MTDNDAFVYFSTDTIKFDTIFVSAGSITQSFKVYNPNEGLIRFSSIRLMGGSSSAFRININGQATSNASDIELDANDSMYVFVTANINPQTGVLPFLINDSIRFAWNGNESFVQLQAYGQNAYFLRNKKIEQDTTWTNDLPIVLLDSCIVREGKTLTIMEGTSIYVHANSPLIVEGSLRIEGQKNNEVIFRGDRLDEYYKDIPGSWPGITFAPKSKDNDIRFAVIKNASVGLNLYEPVQSGTIPIVNLHQSIIDNAQYAGIYCSNSRMYADNSLISNCGQGLIIEKGGDYQLAHCTLVSYSTEYMFHNKPVVSFSNSVFENNTLITAGLHALLQNCLIWGDGGIGNNEVELLKENASAFDVEFDHCLYRSDASLSDAILNSCLQNMEPVFDSLNFNKNYFDFRTTHDMSSPNVDAGTNNSNYPNDLDDVSRVVGVATDIGCYEKQQ